MQKETLVFSTSLILLKMKFRPLLFLGGLTFIFSTLVSMIFYADIGQKTEEIKSITEFSEIFLPTFIKLILISIPFIMATWFSPMLIFYNQYGAMKAIKSSLAGTLMFSIPLLLGWVVLTGSFVVIILLMTLFFSSLSFLGQNSISFLSSLFLLVSFTVYISIMFIFQYVTYKDIFESLKIKL